MPCLWEWEAVDASPSHVWLRPWPTWRCSSLRSQRIMAWLTGEMTSRFYETLLCPVILITLHYLTSACLSWSFNTNFNFIIQMLLKNAGVKGQKTVFLLTDAQIKNEAFLEDVDSVLNTGEVPNLFAVDEKQEIMEVGCYRTLWSSSYLILFICVYDNSYLSFFRRYVPLPRVEIRIWS